MPQRHPLLYDVERWRRWRLRLLVLAVLCLLPAMRIGTRGANAGLIQFYMLVSAFLFALAFAFWLRARFSWARIEDDALVVRVALSGKQRIPLAEMRRAKLTRLRTVFDRPEKQRVLPNPRARWLDRQTVLVRLDDDAVDLVRLRRLLGPRCVIGRELVLPVVDSPRLLGDIESRLAPAPRTPATAGAGGGARRRKRR
jgi:hypothetical protein